MPYAYFARKSLSLKTLMDDIPAREFSRDECKHYTIAEEKELSNQEWQDFTGCLLEDRDWIRSFSATKHVSDGAIPCIRVTTPGSEIALIIDPSGYAYARYVAIEAKKKRTWFCTESRRIMTEADLREEYEYGPDKDEMTFEEYIKMCEAGETLRRFSIAADCDRDEDEDSFEIEDEDEPAEELSEEEVVDGLRALLMGESLDCTALDSCVRTQTFAEGGYLTYDQGFTIHMADGSVFQITVKQER